MARTPKEICEEEGHTVNYHYEQGRGGAFYLVNAQCLRCGKSFGNLNGRRVCGRRGIHG